MNLLLECILWMWGVCWDGLKFIAIGVALIALFCLALFILIFLPAILVDYTNVNWWLLLYIPLFGLAFRLANYLE